MLGSEVGITDGTIVGVLVGVTVGSEVGITDGTIVGVLVGVAVGCVVVGKRLGKQVG